MFVTRILRKRWVLGVIFVLSLLYFVISLYDQAFNNFIATNSDKQKRKSPNDINWNAFNITDRLTCRNSVQGKVHIADEQGFVCLRGDVLSSGCCDVSKSTTQRYACQHCRPNSCCDIYENCISCCMKPDKNVQEIHIPLAEPDPPVPPDPFSEAVENTTTSMLNISTEVNATYTASPLQNNTVSLPPTLPSQKETQPLLRKILGKAADTFNTLFSSVTDHFELCLVKCRTSSLSVQHENSYRDPVDKFCYGENLPDLRPVVR